MDEHNSIDREVEAQPESWGQHFGSGVGQMLFLWYSAGFGGGCGRKTVKCEFNPCIQTDQKKQQRDKPFNKDRNSRGKCSLMSAGCCLGNVKENYGSLGIVDLKLIY